MSSRGFITNNLYVNVQIKFEDAWNDLDSNEQKEIVFQNIDLLDDNDLITELENRGYIVTKDEE